MICNLNLDRVAWIDYCCVGKIRVVNENNGKLAESTLKTEIDANNKRN